MTPNVHYKITDLTVSYTDTSNVDPSDFERHCHTGYEILLVCNGSGSFIVEGVKYPLTTASLMVFRPNEYHYVCPDAGSRYERIVVNFQPSVLTESVSAKHFFSHNDRSAGNGLYFAGDRLHSSVIGSLEIAIREIRESQEKSKSEEVLSTILSCTVSEVLLILSQSVSADSRQKDTSTEAKIINYLNEHLSESFTLKSLAKRFLISDSYLCRIFHEATGLTVHEYVNAKRIALAKQLLRQGVPATEVAYQIGFSDYSTFFRTYKKITGQSPKQLN